METQSRYKLVGAFTLAVILAGFAFVYWLYNTGGIRDRATYRIEFESSVSGLLVGSAVQFNGIRVGEVSRLRLDPQDPKRVIATINVEQDTPIAADTAVELVFQGFTSAPAINLIGGKNDRENRPPTSSVGIYTLKAGPGAGETITGSATRVLRRIDDVVATNAEPVRKLVKNLETFSDALAKNSDRVEGILAGIEQMTGAQDAARKRQTFDLAVPVILPRPEKPLRGLLVVEEPTVLLAFNTDRLLVQRSGSETARNDAVIWTDNLPNLVQAKIVRSFENAGYLKSVSRPMIDAQPDYKLQLDIRRFDVSQGDNPAAEIEMLAKVIGGSGRILDGKLFAARVAIKTPDAQGSIKGLEIAFAKTINELIPWVVDTASKSPVTGSAATQLNAN